MITNILTLFNIEYGQKIYHNKESIDGEYGGNILISSKGEDNGVYGFFNINNFYKAPFITIPSTGTIGHAFVQENDCSVDDNCLVLIPKKDFKYTLEDLYSIAFQIRKNKWRYKYGRQITPKRIASQEVVLLKTKCDIDRYKKSLLPKNIKKKCIEENKKNKFVILSELCVFEKKLALPQNQLDLDGPTPYITTTSKNNGISNFVFEESNSEGRCLTVALNGSVGEVFFQFNNFITSSDNVILRLKGNYNPYLLFYIGSFIRREKWRYNYYRKMSIKKLKNLSIPIPLDSNNNIDAKYIETIVKNSYGFDIIEKYL